MLGRSFTYRKLSSILIILVLIIIINITAGGSEPHLGRSLALEEDDALLQFALHQSLLDGAGVPPPGATMDVWEALQQGGRGHTGGSWDALGTHVGAGGNKTSKGLKPV